MTPRSARDPVPLAERPWATTHQPQGGTDSSAREYVRQGGASARGLRGRGRRHPRGHHLGVDLRRRRPDVDRQGLEAGCLSQPRRHRQRLRRARSRNRYHRGRGVVARRRLRDPPFVRRPRPRRLRKHRGTRGRSVLYTRCWPTHDPDLRHRRPDDQGRRRAHLRVDDVRLPRPRADRHRGPGQRHLLRVRPPHGHQDLRRPWPADQQRDHCRPGQGTGSLMRWG